MTSKALPHQTQGEVMHNPEDEQIALDAKCPDTVEMFPPVLKDKCITDDFPKQIDQRNNPEE